MKVLKVFTTAELQALKKQPARVPCGNCSACCRHDRVMLGPEDDPMAYRWHAEGGYAVLDRKANGECTYLNDGTCSIHERAPSICRRFDCRVLVLITPPETMRQRAQENPQMAEVYSAGRARAETLQLEFIAAPAHPISQSTPPAH